MIGYLNFEMISQSGDNNFLQAFQFGFISQATKVTSICVLDSKRKMEKKGNPLTRQGALCNRSERRGDSPRVIDNPLTCQGALCNRRERQGDSPRVIDNPLTCQGAFL